MAKKSSAQRNPREPRYSVANQQKVTAQAAVSYIRPELERMLKRWKLVEDCIAGSMTIKQAGTEYLPMPNPLDQSDENIARYRAYVCRAMFYAITGYTLEGMLGQVFQTPPAAELPANLEVIQTDADGGGVSLDQQSQLALSYVMQFARAGVLVDYPKVPEGVSTVAELETGKVRPRIILYRPHDIINWRTVTVGGKILLSLVVLRESYPMSDDGFREICGFQFRVLRLINGYYHGEVWRASPEKDGAAFEKVEDYDPTQADGKQWEEIPFSFIGSSTNDACMPVTTPLYDLAELNIAHYRNSADYEESVFLVGQPTPWVSGVTKDWVKDVFGGKLNLGSRSVISLPEKGAAGLLQAEPNTLSGEAMKGKEEQMRATGAKLIMPGQVQKTATETAIQNTADSCILAKCASNVSTAYEKALNWAALFIGASEKPEYKLNTDFDAATMSAQDIAQLIASWQAKAITTSEMRESMKETGIATLDLEAYQSEIDTAGPDMGLPVDPLQKQTDAANAVAAAAKAKGAVIQASAAPAKK